MNKLIFIFWSSFFIVTNSAGITLRENAAEGGKIDIIAELLGSFKIKMSKNEPSVEKLLNTLSMLKAGKNVTMV